MRKLKIKFLLFALLIGIVFTIVRCTTTFEQQVIEPPSSTPTTSTLSTTTTTATAGSTTTTSTTPPTTTSTTSSTTTTTTTTPGIALPGDVNKDGYADVIVGAVSAGGGGNQRGQAYVFLGGSSLDNTADVTITGATNSDQLGSSVSSAGDVNNDGYADIIVGVPFADGGGTNRGQAYIYFGGSSMDNTADVTMTGAADSDSLGGSVSGAKK